MAEKLRQFASRGSTLISTTRRYLAKKCFSLEKISRIRDGVSMYAAFQTLHNSRQTVIGSRTSSRRCEQTTKSKVLSGNGQGELHTSCTIQVSAVKRSSSS